jgi:soluble lytic murein transglycosylase-like protein
MQLVKATAGRFGVWDPYDPQQAIEGGCRYLAWLTNRYGRDRLDLVLAAYNAGEGAVDRYERRVPPYAETQNYVRRILAEYERATRLEDAIRLRLVPANARAGYTRRPAPRTPRYSLAAPLVLKLP